VHGQDLPPFASSESQAADGRLKDSYDHIARLKNTLAEAKKANEDSIKNGATTINWWEQRDRQFFNPTPQEVSLRMLMTKQKWYAKPDQIYTTEHTDKIPEEDVFKRYRSIAKKSKIDFYLCEKPT